MGIDDSLMAEAMGAADGGSKKATGNLNASREGRAVAP